MTTQRINEPNDAQSQLSQETSAQAEVSTVNKIKQADQVNEAANVESLNAESNISSAQSETNAGNIISNTTNLKANTAVSSNKISNIISEDSNLQKQISDQSNAVCEKKQHEQVKKFTRSVPQFYSIEARWLYECGEDKYYDLAIETIKNTQKNVNAGKILIALAAHAVWSRTPAEKGGRGNKVAPGEGRKNVLDKFSADCLSKGIKISPATLHDYVGRIQKLVEDPLKQFEGKSKEFITQERAKSIDNLFLVPMGFLKIASQTTKPAEALAIACEKKANEAEALAIACEKKANKDTKFTENQYKEAISHLIKKAVDTKDDKASSFDNIVILQLKVVAGRANVSFEQVVEIYISILQLQLSIFKDMGVKE